MHTAREAAGGVRWIDLADLLTATDISEIELLCSSLTPEGSRDLEVDGLAVGRFAAYETLIHAKARPDDALNSNWPGYLADLRGSLLTLRAVQNLHEVEPLDAVVVYGALYSYNRTVWEWARHAGVATVNIHAASHPNRGYEFLNVKDELWPSFDARESAAWTARAGIPLSPTEVEFADSYLRGGILGTAAWTYSPKTIGAGSASATARLGIVTSRPVILVLLNSLDERVAAHYVGVRTSSAWPENAATPLDVFVEKAVELARLNPDFQVVIRVHPRMAANMRDHTVSPELGRLRQSLATAPSNVLVDWPEFGLSLYDVAAVADCALSIGTTAGLQLLALGVPVILCDSSQEMTFALDLYSGVVDGPVDELEAAIRKAIRRRRDLGLSVRAYRFIVFKYGLLAHRVIAQSASSEGRPSEAAPPLARLKRAMRKFATERKGGRLWGLSVAANAPLRARGFRRTVLHDLNSEYAASAAAEAVLNSGVAPPAINSPRRPRSDDSAQEEADALAIQESLAEIFALLGWSERNTGE